MGLRRPLHLLLCQSQGFNIRPQRFQIGVLFGHLFDRRLTADANCLIQPPLRHIQLTHLAGVTRQIVRNHTFFRKFDHNRLQELKGFVGPTKFMKCVTLVDPAGRQLRSHFNIPLSGPKGFWPGRLGGQNPPIYFQRDRVAGCSWAESLEFPRRFGSISKPQPAFGSFNVMTVREPQLFHDECLYGAQPRSVKSKMPQTLPYPLLFGRNHPASPTR